MGNFLRRVVAFLLGIVFTITSLVGGVVGGAYYAYKNVHPLESAGSEFGDLQDATIEELVDLIANGMNPDTYGDFTLERLMEEYGLDLATILSDKLGLDLSGVDTESKDWKALTSLSLSSLLTGDFDELLNSVKLRSLFVLVPAVLGAPIDDFLSPEAQSALGDYTISELIGTVDGGSNELGIVHALKNLKIGSLLPEIFGYEYDVNTHEYIYSVKQDGALKNFAFLDLVGNVPFKGIFNIVEGKDVMTELFEGEFKSLTSMKIVDVLNSFGKVAGDDIYGVISQYTQIFGDVTVSDLFSKNDEGVYEFALENLLGGLQFGYLAGLTKNEDGEWIDSEGNAPTGLIAFIASISLKGVMNSDGDVIAMINDTIGDLSLMSIIETVYPRDSYPVFLERLGTIKVSSILCDGADGVLSNLKLSLKVALRGMTVGDAVDMVLDLIGDDGSLKANIESIEIVKALMTIEVNEFIRDVYTAKDIIRVFDDAVGDLTVGKAFGLASTGNALDLLYDYELGNIFDGVIAILDGAKASEIVGAFVGQYTFGDVFGAITGYEYSDAKDNWGKDGKYIGEGLVTLLKTSIAEFAKTFDKDSGYDVTAVVGDIQLADVIYTVLQLVGIDDILVEDRDGDFVTYVAGGDFADFAPLSKIILTITVNDLMKNVTSGEYWLDRAEKIALGDLTAYVVNHFLGEDINFTYANGKWTVDSEYLTTLLSNFVNVTIGGIISAVQNGTVFDLIVDTVGDTSIGDVTYAVLGIAGIDGIIEKTSTAYQMAGELSDFNKFAQSVFGLSITDIIENASDVDWWFTKLGDVRIGDLVAYFINKYAPEMSATDDDGWTVTGTLGSLLSGLFNVTFNQLRDVSNTFIRDAFGFLSIGDVVETFVPEEYLSKTFIQALTAVTVNDIIDVVQCQTMEQLVDKLQDIFDGVGVGDLVDVFADVSNYEYGVFERVLNTDFDFVFGLLIANDVFDEVVAEYGEISVGEVAYTVLKTMGIEDIVVPVTAVNGNAKSRAVAKSSVGGYTLSSDYADLAPLADKLLSIDFEEVANNLNGEYWLDRAGSISVGDVSAYVINQLIGVEGLSLTHNGSTWTVNSDYLEELLENLFNFTVSDVTDIIDGNTDVITLVTEILGNTSIGDIVYAGLGFAGVKDVITETSSGYAIPSDYEELNNLAQVILKLEISDIIENVANVNFWLDNFDAITVGDLVDILLSDELENNEFISVLRGISVNDVRGWMESDVNGIASDLEKAFVGVKLQHLVNVFYSDDIGIDVVDRLLDTDVDFLFSLVNSDNAIDDIFKEYSDIDLGLVLGQYIEGVIDTENAFVASTLSFGVADVYNVWLGESVVDVVIDLYNKVTVGDAVNAIYDTTGLAYDPANTVLELKINDVINAFVEDEIVEFLIETFGEVTIGDVILPHNLHITMFGHEISYDRAWIVEGELGELITNIFNVNLNDILDNVENQNNLRANMLELVGKTTIGNAGKLIYANDLNIGALQRIYDIKLSDIVDEIFDGTILQYLLNDVLFEISVDELIGFALPESVRANEFVSATFAINTNTVLDILDNDTAEDILMAVSELYDGVTLGDIVQLFGIEEAPISSLEPIFKAELDGLIASIAKNEVLDYVMIDVIGGLTVNNVITDIESLTNTVILGELRENNFVDDVLNVSAGGVYKAIIGENVLYDIGAMFTGSTIGDVVEIFTEIPEFEALQTLCTIGIGATLQGIANDDLTALTDTLVEAFEQLPEAAQYGIIAGVGVAGVVLYFVSNSTLLDIIDLMLGKGATWGDLLGEALGYSLSGNKYVSTLGYNGLMGVMLGSTVTETLTTGYPLLNTVKDHVTLGNLLTAYPDVALWIEESLGMYFAEVDGNWTLDNEFTDLAENLFNVSLADFLTEENKFITSDEVTALMHETFDKNNVGDVLAYFINLLGEEPVAEKANGKWGVEGLVLDEVITNVLNITFGGIYKAVKADDKTPYVEKAKALFGDTSVGALAYDVAGLAGDGVIVDGTSASGYALKEELEDFNDLAQIVFAIKLVDIVDNITDGEYWLNVVKPVQLGYLVNYFLPEEIENNNFISTTLSVSVNDVISWTSAGTSVNDIVLDLENKYAGVTVSDVVALFTDSTIENEALLKLVNIGISDLLDLIICDSPEDSILALVGDINVGEVFGLVPVYSTAFERETFAIDVEDIYGLVRGLIDGNGINAVVDTFNSIYQTSSVGSVVYSFGVKSIENQALIKLFKIQLSDLVNLAVSNDVLASVRNLLKDITLGDAISQYLKVDNDFVDATLGFGFETIFKILEANDVADFINVVKGLYEGVTIGDIVSLAIDLSRINDALDKILDSKINDVIDIVFAEDVIGEIGKVYGDISLGDAIGDVLEGAGVDIDNAFLSATLSFGVQEVLDLITDGDVLAILFRLYEEVTVYNVVELFTTPPTPSNVATTVYDLNLYDIIESIANRRFFEYLVEELEEVVIGDVVFNKDQEIEIFGYTISYRNGSWMVSSGDENLDTLITNLLNVNLGDIVDTAEGKAEFVDQLLEIVDDTTIRELGEKLYKNESGIGVIEKLYNVKLYDIINSANKGTFLTYVKDFACDITVYDVVGFLISDAEIRNNAFVKASLSVSGNTVIDIVDASNAGGASAILNEIADLYTGVKFKDVTALAGLKDSPLETLNTVFDAGIDGLLRAISDEKVSDYLLSIVDPISIGNLVADIEKLTDTETALSGDNGFFTALRAIDVEAIRKTIVSDTPIDNVCDMFEGVTVGDVVKIFTSDDVTNEALQKLTNIYLSDLISLIGSTDVENDLVDMLGNISIGDVFGLQPVYNTVFERETYGIDVEDIYNLVKGLINNPSVEVVVDTFNGIYKQSTILSVLYAFGLEEPSNNALAKLTGIKLSDLANLIVSSDLVKDIRTLVGDITLGDAVREIIGVQDNAFLEATYNFSVGSIFDIIEAEGVDNKLKVITDLYTGVKVLDVVKLVDSLANTAFAENANGAIQKLYAIKLLDIVDAVKAEDKVGELVKLVGDVTVGDVISQDPQYVTQFTKETYSISVNDVYTLVQGIVEGKVLDATKEFVNDVYGSSTINDVVLTFGMELDNVALNKVADTKISKVLDILTGGKILEDVNEEFGDITVGDAVSQYVGVQDNAFLNATYEFSIGHIFDIIEAEGLGNKLKVVTDLYKGVKVLDVATLIDAFTGTSLGTIGNEAVQKVYALELLAILDVVKADDKAGELVKLVGDITVANVTSKEPTRNTVFMQETYAISVSDVYDLVKGIVGGKGVSGIVEIFNSIYVESTINGVLASFGLETPTNPALVKLVSIKLSDVANLAVSKDILSNIRTMLGDITLGDCVSEFVKVENNAFLEATYKFSVNHAFEILEVEGLGNKLKVITDLYKGVKVLDVATLIDALAGTSLGTIGNEAVQKVYALELLDLAKVIVADDKAGELVKLIGDITVANVTSKEPTRNTVFMQETYAISVSDVYDLVKGIVGGKGVSGIVEIFNSIYVESTINGVLASFGLETPTNPALVKLVSIKLSDVASIAVSNQRKADIRTLIGDVTLGDAFSGIIGKVIDGNNVFVQETLGLSVEHVFKVLDNLSVGNAVRVVASLYTNATLEDVVKVVLTSFSTSRESINTALALNIGEAMNAVIDRDYSYFTNYAKSIYNVTTRNEKLILAGVAGVGAGALYFINNDLLVKLVDKVLGEGATFGDILAGVFGYELVDGEYKINGLSNGLMNTFLSEEISTFLTKGYPFFGKFRSEITIGNLLTVHSKIVNAFANRNLPIAIDADGKTMISGYLANISKSILSLGLGDVITADKQFVGTSGIKTLISERFGANTLGDIIAIVVNNQDIVNITAEYSKTASQWVVTGKGASILNRVFNVTFSEVYRLVKNRDLSTLSDLIGDTTFLNLATALRPSLADNKTASLVLSIRIKDALNVVRGNLSVKDLVGDWTLGELAGDYLPDRINTESAFAKVFLNLTLSDVYAISKNPLDEAIGRFGEFTFGEVLGFVGYDASSTDDELVKTILDLKLNIFSGGLNAGIDEIMNTVKSKELGLILGYTKGEDGYWYDGSKKLTGILATVAGKSINEISDPDFFDSLTLGEALGYTYNETEDKWYDSDNKPVTGVMGAFAGKTIGQISKDPNGAVDDVVLGEALGYTKVEVTDATGNVVKDSEGNVVYKWQDSNGKDVTGVMAAFAGKTIGQISKDPTSAINTVVLGEALGYAKGTDGKWYSDSACTKPVTGALATLADKTIGDISEDPDFINKMKLGEALGYTTVTDANGNVTWKDSNGKDVTGVMAAFVDKTIGDISNDPNSIVNTVVLGEALGYEKENGVWYSKDTSGNKTKVTGALATLADKTIGEISEDPNFINNMYLGEALGYTKGTDSEGNVIWKDSQGIVADGIMSAFVGLQIKDLNDNDKLKEQVESLTLKDVIDIDGNTHPILAALGDSKIGDLSTSIESIKLGTALGYNYNKDDGKWYSDSAYTKPVTGVMSELAGKTIKEMADAENIIKGIELGTALGYTKDGNVWKDSSGPVTGIMKSFVGVKIGELNENKMKEIVNGLTLGDVIDDTSGNNILNALKGVPIGSLSNEINNMYLGVVMGYTPVEDNQGNVIGWKSGEQDVTDGLATKIANWTVENIAKNGITADQFVVSDVFSASSATDSETKALIEFISTKNKLDENGKVVVDDKGNVVQEDVKLSEIPSVMTDKFETMTVQQAMDMGILNLDKTAQDNLDTIFATTSYNWKELSITNFITAIIEAAVANPFS